MPVTIRIYGKEAQFTEGQWRCDDDGVLAMLDALADPRARTPDAEYEHALYCAGRFGGAVWTSGEWRAAELPEPEMKIDDYVPPKRKSEGGGWFPWGRKKR